MEDLAFVGKGHQVQIKNLHTEELRQLTYALSLDLRADQQGCSWPVWSPDRKWIAYFQLNQSRGVSICIAENDGIEVRVLDELTDAIPIYMYWSPNGRRLAVLLQRTEMEVLVYDVDGLTNPIGTLTGGPIFFAWSPHSDGLYFHLIQRLDKSSRFTYFPLNGEGEQVISTKVGAFCSPLHTGDGLLYIRSEESSCYIEHLRHRTESSSLAEVSGMVSMLLSPRADCLAYGENHREGHDAYPRLELLPLSGGKERTLDLSCQSFHWRPDQRGIVFSRMNRKDVCMEWWYWNLETEATHKMASFWPTREQILQLHFFEQYAQSHGSFSRDGCFFVYSGYEAPAKRRGDVAVPQIYCIDLDCDSEPAVLAEGMYPSFCAGLA
jgi:hypothetical protein